MPTTSGRPPRRGRWPAAVQSRSRACRRFSVACQAPIVCRPLPEQHPAPKGYASDVRLAAEPMSQRRQAPASRTQDDFGRATGCGQRSPTTPAVTTTRPGAYGRMRVSAGPAPDVLAVEPCPQLRELGFGTLRPTLLQGVESTEGEAVVAVQV